MQSRRLFDIFVMRADYWVVVSLVSTGALAKLLSSWVAPAYTGRVWSSQLQDFPFPFIQLHELSLGIFLQTFEGLLNGGTVLWCTEMHMLPCKTSCYPCFFQLVKFLSFTQQLFSSYSISPSISNLQILPMPERDT